VPFDPFEKKNRAQYSQTNAAAQRNFLHFLLAGDEMIGLRADAGEDR
jgi:hypothetical protein